MPISGKEPKNPIQDQRVQMLGLQVGSFVELSNLAAANEVIGAWRYNHLLS